MNAFSLIGLMISIFGSTYMAMAALKDWLDPIIEKTKTDRLFLMKKLEEEFKNKTTIQKTAKSYNRIGGIYCRIYLISQMFPIIMFIFITFGLAFEGYYTDWNNPILAGEHLWKQVLFLMIWLNLICLATIIISSAMIWNTNKKLDNHYKSVVESKMDIKPVETKQVTPSV